MINLPEDVYRDSGASPPRFLGARPLEPIRVIAPPASLVVMNKRKLPAVLRRNVPSLSIAETLVQPLIATRTNLHGVLHSDVGKRIRHKGRSVTVVNVHENIRKIEDSDGNGFWIPRRAADKEQLRKQRIARQFAQGIRKVFSQPCWTGDSADGLVAVPFPESNVLSIEEACHLVHKLGYDGRAAFDSLARPLMEAKSDRKRLGVFQTKDGKWRDRTNIAQPIPYVAAPSRGTHRGFFSRDSVLKAIASMRSSHKMRMAAFQVVFSRHSPTQVAEEFGVGRDALKKAATRVRERIRGPRSREQKVNVYAASA